MGHAHCIDLLGSNLFRDTLHFSQGLQGTQHPMCTMGRHFDSLDTLELLAIKPPGSELLTLPLFRSNELVGGCSWKQENMQTSNNTTHCYSLQSFCILHHTTNRTTDHSHTIDLIPIPAFQYRYQTNTQNFGFFTSENSFI